MPERRGPRSNPAADLVRLEGLAEAHMLASDQQTGLVPPTARRALLPHELQAGTNFSELDAAVTAAGGDIGGRLAADRLAFLDLVERDLAAQAAFGAPAVINRVLDLEGLGALSVTGARQLVETAVADHQRRLLAVHHAGGLQVRREATSQGVPVPAGPPPAPAPGVGVQLDLAARRLAQGPFADALRALREKALTVDPAMSGADAVAEIMAAGRGLAQAPLDTYGASAAAGADGLGRQAGTQGMSAPSAVYASELLDSATCGPCSLIDGTEYPDLAAARADYPLGTYVRCDGGLRCRGTLVFVWDTEAPPTVP